MLDDAEDAINASKVKPQNGDLVLRILEKLLAKKIATNQLVAKSIPPLELIF